MTVPTFICWKWRSDAYPIRYAAKHVNVLRETLRRTYNGAHRFICITDDPRGIECETFPLWSDHSDLFNPAGAYLPSCYRRLKIFDRATTEAMWIATDSPIVSIDLDVVVLHDLSPIVSKCPESDFIGWRTTVGGHDRPMVYNGSLFRFRAGTMGHLWSDFDPDHSPAEARANRFFGSDQGWMSYKLANAYPSWGREDGVVGFVENLSPLHHHGELPANARIVCFNGLAKPWDADVRLANPWIADRWPGEHKPMAASVPAV